MTDGVGIFRCTNCGRAFFPERLLCPSCHGAEFAPDRVHGGVVEEVTTIRHVLGQADWQPRRLANVRTSDGQRITVGLRDSSGPGDAIVLFQDGGAPFGEAKRG